MKLGGLFKAIKKAFRREEEPLSTKPAPPQPITAPFETSIAVDSLKDSKHISDLYSHLADSSLVRNRGIDLNRISVNAIGLKPRVLASLLSANIRTVEQLSNCTKMDLYRLRSIGMTRLAQIQEELDLFLKSMLADGNEKPATQLSFGSTEQQERTGQEDLRQQLSELTTRLYDIFRRHIPSSRELLPPHVWNDLVEALGEEPRSFDELEQSVQEPNKDFHFGVEEGDTGRYLALKRTVQWLKRAIEYGCLDEEIQYVVNSLDERERLILTSRYKIERPLTLKALGEELGITRGASKANTTESPEETCRTN